jgi:hypothetical protein
MPDFADSSVEGAISRVVSSRVESLCAAGCCVLDQGVGRERNMYRVCKCMCGWQLQTGNGEDVQLASSVEPPLACVYPPVPATVIDNPAYCGDVAGWRGGCAIDQSDLLRSLHSDSVTRASSPACRQPRKQACSSKDSLNAHTSQTGIRKHLKPDHWCNFQIHYSSQTKWYPRQSHYQRKTPYLS